MPSLAEWADRALNDSRERRRVATTLAAWGRRRALASQNFTPDHRTTHCPCCGDGLKRASGQHWLSTVLYCGRCHWSHVLPFVMDEARTPGSESFTPGVTAKAHGTVHAVIRQDGTLVKLVDSKGRKIALGGS